MFSGVYLFWHTLGVVGIVACCILLAFVLLDCCLGHCLIWCRLVCGGLLSIVVFTVR